MRTWPLLVRFFRVVAPVPAVISVVAMAVLAACMVLTIAAPGAVSSLLSALLVLQIFAASSGVIGPARRGYYDGLLSRGVGRGQILCGHWLASTVPGALCWMVVAAMDHATAPAPRTLTSGSLVALWLASSIPWAATVALPRFAAAIAWLVVLVVMLTALPSGQASLLGALYPEGPSIWAGVAAVVYPMGLIGQSLSPGQWVAVAPGLTLSLLATTSAFLWFLRADIPLEASQ